LDFIKSLAGKFPDFFVSSEIEEEKEEEKTGANDAMNDDSNKFNNRWFWYTIFHTLKGNDIDAYGEVEQMNYNKVLIHLSFLSQKNRLENKK